MGSRAGAAHGTGVSRQAPRLRPGQAKASWSWKGSEDIMSRYCPTAAQHGGGQDGDAPVSKTYTYKKITKPLLERKRRARINACLDELKDIMTGALQAEGENVSKLEKADILELTVRHLQKLAAAQRLVLGARSPVEEIARFRQGYATCAQEAAQFLFSSPGVDMRVGQRLLSHVLGDAPGPQGAPGGPPGGGLGTPHSPPASPPGNLPPGAAPSFQALVHQQMLSSLLSSSSSSTTSPPSIFPASPPSPPTAPPPPPPPQRHRPLPLKPSAVRAQP